MNTTQIEIEMQRDHNRRVYNGKWQAREGCYAIVTETMENAVKWLEDMGVTPVAGENYWKMVC